MAEHPETYCYMDYFEKKFIRKHTKMDVVKISRQSHPNYYTGRVNKSNCSGLEDYCLYYKIIPFFSFRFCTQEFKSIPMRAWLKEAQIDKTLLGFAYDEKHRAKENPGHEYPLVEDKVTRQGCIDIIKAKKYA